MRTTRGAADHVTYGGLIYTDGAMLLLMLAPANGERMMNPKVRTRGLLVLLAVAVVLLARGSAHGECLGTAVAFAAAYANAAVSHACVSHPFLPTPFGTPPGPQFTPTVTPDFRIVNEIIHPSSGDAVAGFVPIIGTAVITDFVEYQVHLSPSGAENWSWLATNRKVVRNGICTS